MRYYIIKNTQGKKPTYWGYAEGKAPQHGKPNAWVTDYDHIHLYESEVKLRYAKAEVIAQCTDVPVKHITTSEVWL